MQNRKYGEDDDANNRCSQGGIVSVELKVEFGPGALARCGVHALDFSGETFRTNRECVRAW